MIRRTPRRNLATDAMSPAAAEIRFAIRSVLSSWSALVAEERHLAGPVRDIAELARFLNRHLDWLAGHPAAGELVDEVRTLVGTARRIAYPDTGRRVRIGHCPHSDCDGDLTALIRHRGDRHPPRIVCTTTPGHSWPVTWWNTLARQMRTKEREHETGIRAGRSDGR
ncbi:hypothetical protein ABZZ79_09300 [Streptomyces sp. NPDC006458]|uniref:hypothetical protein n=1 Tax=Streptomyces sp. NPDC006458 TaxID=3154302 RepID=UPI0033BC649D